VKKILTAFQVSVMTEDEAGTCFSFLTPLIYIFFTVESQMPFRIEKESVFNELVAFCLANVTDIFYDLLEEEGKRSAKPAKPTEYDFFFFFFFFLFFFVLFCLFVCCCYLRAYTVFLRFILYPACPL
jgi:hypothetical protein